MLRARWAYAFLPYGWKDDGFKRVEDAVLGGAQENKGAVEEQKKKEASARKKELTLFGEIAFGIKAMNKSLQEGLAKLQDKGLGGLGMIAALIAGPFIAIAAFFKQIALELKFLQTLVKGNRIQKAFAPIKNFFAAVVKLTLISCGRFWNLILSLFWSSKVFLDITTLGWFFLK